MIEIKTSQDIMKIKKSCEIVAELLAEIELMIKPGISTIDLDIFAEIFIRKRKGVPAFKGYRNYPSTICASINEVIVHGIPNEKKLKEGDIVGIDVGVILDGYYGDAAATFAVGKIEEKYLNLINVTKQSLYVGIEQAVENKKIGDISHAIQEYVESRGYNVIRDFVGHGVGLRLHEEPKIPNYGEQNTGPRLRAGMVLAIEPMVCMGNYEVEILEDEWTARTKDGSYAAHFEHTIVITNDKPIILTQKQN